MTIDQKRLGLDEFDRYKANEWRSLRPLGRHDLSGDEFEVLSNPESFLSVPAVVDTEWAVLGTFPSICQSHIEQHT